MGGLLFSAFAQMMKAGFWLHLGEVLKCDLIIIKKKKKSFRTQPACPSKPKMLSELHFKGVFFFFSHLLNYKEQENQERRQEWF